MKYWDDMQTKWGFSDGAATPCGIEAYREVYVQAVNYLAAQAGSAVRAEAYDRPGMHNSCLIVLVSIHSRPGDPVTPLVDPDEGMKHAIRQAHNLGLDSYVTATACVTAASWKELKRALADAAKGSS